MEPGRTDRFDALARECLEPLRRYLSRRTDPETAADVLGDTLLVAWRRFDDVPEQPLPWLYGVARNCLANAERGVRRRARLAARLAEQPADVEGAGAAEAEALLEALEQLGDVERELVRLWAWEQLTPAEIAIVVGLTPNAVSIRLTRARQHLRELLAAPRKSGDLAGHEGA